MRNGEPPGQICCEIPGHHRHWYRDSLFWTAVTAIAFWCLPMCVPALRPMGEVYWDYVQKIWWAIGLGLVLGGVIDRYVPKEYISSLLALPHKKTIPTAVGLGFLASGCSHGCLALTMELYKKGASTPATLSFLLASPWASLSLTLLMISLFGLKGLLIVALALVIATLTGWFLQGLQLRGLIKTNPHTVMIPPHFSIREDLARRLTQWSWRRNYGEDVKGIWRGMVELARMVLFWVNLGIALSALLGALIPHAVFQRYLGPSLLGLGATVVLATLVEVCSEGSAPLAFELYRQTRALGNAFAFLMGGVLTDYTELSLIWANMGRKAVFWLLLVSLPQVIFLALLLNQL